MDKRIFKKLDKEIGIPRWQEISASDPAHNWSSGIMQRVGCMMPEQACRVIKLLTGKCKFNAKSDFIPVHDEVVKVVQAYLGIIQKGKYPDPKHYALKDKDAVLTLIATVRNDTMKVEDKKVTDVTPDEVTKKAKGKKTGGKKAGASKKKAGRKKVGKKTTTTKKTGGKKTGASKKKASRKKSSSPLVQKGDKGPLSEVGGKRNWPRFEDELGEKFKVNPEVEGEPRGDKKKQVVAAVLDSHGKKMKLSALVEEVGRGPAYMAVNIKLIVKV